MSLHDLEYDYTQNLIRTRYAYQKHLLFASGRQGTLKDVQNKDWSLPPWLC